MCSQVRHNAAITPQGQQSNALHRFSDRNERTTLRISYIDAYAAAQLQHSKSRHIHATAT